MSIKTAIRFAADELEMIRALVRRETGILIERKKNYYLENRLSQRMENSGCSSFREYYDRLTADSQRHEEVQCLIEAITINETYFFRDFPQLRGFAEEVLPKYAAAKRANGQRSLRIWSAACSTGEEPYTIAIILREMLDDFEDWNIRIEATDIDRKVIRYAEQGIYSDRSIRETPLIYRRQYFRQSSVGWELDESIRSCVRFDRLNLSDPAMLASRRGYDMIFCRNVLIYFDEDSRRKVVDGLYDALLPGGCLFLGHAESVGRITAAFRLEKIGEFPCYRK